MTLEVLLIIFSRHVIKFTTPQRFTCWASVLDIVLNCEVKVALSSRALVPSSQKITNKLLMHLL